MTSTIFKSTVTTSLSGLAFLALSSFTNAGEYHLWREQVQTAPGEPTVLAAGIKQGMTPDYRMWREQRDKNSSDEAQVVYIAPLSRSRYLPGSDYRLWREQVQPAGYPLSEDLALRN